MNPNHSNNESSPFTRQALLQALSNKLDAPITDVDYQSTQLQGGTLGDVRLINGTAKDASDKNYPFQIVFKRQNRWQRPGDPSSWRREYDLYQSTLGQYFTDSLRWPWCYHMEKSEDSIQLWMEYITGPSGNKLTLSQLEQSVLEWGRFQGRLYQQKTDSLREITYLSDPEFFQREFSQWHSQTFDYNFLISTSCRIPEFLKAMLREGKITLHPGKSFEYSCLRSEAFPLLPHLRQMLIDIDEQAESIFQQITALPVVLCHRDFWIENIFHTDNGIRLIDWDGGGWGYLGEDIVSLIIDDIDAEHITKYYHQLVPAYHRGLAEYMDLSEIKHFCIKEMILIKFGYRLFQEFMFTQSADVQKEAVAKLEKIYAMDAISNKIRLS